MLDARARGWTTVEIPTKVVAMDYEIREFACARCGNCCRGEGFVRVGPLEAERIASYLDLTVAQFTQGYCREPDSGEAAGEGELWLIDQPGPEKACVFLAGNACLVNAAKPDQCVGFPMTWRTRDAADYCVGLRA